MQQSTISKTKLTSSQQKNTNLIWKFNDGKAQKNGPHSNIYWVKVNIFLFRNNLLTKMVPKKLTNGLGPINMSVIGLIIKSMDSVFSITQMVISMKVDGKLIKDMVRAHIGWLILKINSEESTLEIGTQTKNKAEAQCFTNQETDMMACGWTIIRMVKEE